MVHLISNDLYHPIQAMIIGGIGAAIAYKMHFWLEKKYNIDDAVGAVAVHCYAGFVLWGHPSSVYECYATINPIANSLELPSCLIIESGTQLKIMIIVADRQSASRALLTLVASPYFWTCSSYFCFSQRLCQICQAIQVTTPITTSRPSDP